MGRQEEQPEEIEDMTLNGNNQSTVTVNDSGIPATVMGYSHKVWFN